MGLRILKLLYSTCDTIAYENITVCDKIYASGLIEDDFVVIYRIDSTGELVRDDNMTLFYSVEEGKTYNASFYENTTYLVGCTN